MRKPIDLVGGRHRDVDMRSQAFAGPTVGDLRIGSARHRPERVRSRRDRDSRRLRRLRIPHRIPTRPHAIARAAASIVAEERADHRRFHRDGAGIGGIVHGRRGARRRGAGGGASSIYGRAASPRL